MNFKTFMYYCALCGGWAALIAWAMQQVMGLQSANSFVQSVFVKTVIISVILGVLLAFFIGVLDALMNSVGFARVMRVVICIAVGLVGSAVFGFIGEFIHKALEVPTVPSSQVWALAPGWTLVGAIIGASIGIFDLLRAMTTAKGLKQAIRKIVNGIIGGSIGGFIGGVLNGVFYMLPAPTFLLDDQNIETFKDWLPRTSLAVGLVILGMCIGLLIGVAQVVLKEAWVRVEKGFRAGREMILSKPEVIIGRAEGVDIALFGDMQVEKQHARIMLKGDRYILIDLDTPGGTTVNGQRISGPTPLSNGDMIGCGNSKVRFQEKARR